MSSFFRKRKLQCSMWSKKSYEGMKTVFAPNGTFIPGKMFKLEKKA